MTRLPNLSSLAARGLLLVSLSSLGGLALGCEAPVERPPAPPNEGVFGFANGCYAMDATDPGSNDTRWLAPDPEGVQFRFSARELALGSRFFLKPSDLGTYLFYDAEGRYLTADDEGNLTREAELASDILLVDDSYVSPAEWELQVSTHDPERFQLRHRRSGQYLGRQGLVPDVAAAGVIALYPTNGCREFPELTLDAEGAAMPREFDDGSLFGIVDTHSHIMTNFGFGGGGIFHGAAFHRLGVEHALPDCTQFHGIEGRRDLMGYGYDRGGSASSDDLINTVTSGRTPEFNHYTDGYPTFTDWPAAPFSSTHQTQYYRWLQRAYLAGLRLVVQHATSNQVICELNVGLRAQDVRYSCNDMVAIDREIAETYAMERYIDAQEGGPGRGWFRVVTSPEQAREVIGQGKMAVILGIEVSNLFDCFVTPREGFPTCDAEYVRAQLDRYRELGVRVLFPVHKYDNAFSAGDGMRAIIELGNFVNSGHWSNFTDECDPSVPTVFDHGDVTFGGLNMPRADYLAPAPNDTTGFVRSPVGTMAPYLDELMGPRLEGDYCQNAGLTELGETMIREIMQRGMVLEVDHFPRRAYARVFEIVEEADYPVAGTHGLNYGGRVYALGGISKTGFGRCSDPSRPGSMMDSFRNRVALIEANGGYPAEGFGFDLNGFAGGPGPRFGERSGCGQPQENPVSYPFRSYAGDVSFTQPHLGERTPDFNTEGMLHIGLLPELIEDARRDGATDADLEPLFRSAEGYLRMWERAEARARELP
jgi:microsomal dipeptidase-like Zn-dependent dipeptidase